VELGAGFEMTRMSMLPRGRVASAAHLALFQLQDKTPEEQVLGAALLSLALSRHMGLNPHEVISMANNVLMARTAKDDPVANADLEALRDYAGVRLQGRDTSVY
jgi:hypothetical protein